MRHPEKAKDIQFYLFGQAYTLKKTHQKTDAKRRNELFSVLPSYVVNQCIRNGLNYKAELTPSARRCVQFLTDTLNKLPTQTKEDILQTIQNRENTVIADLIQKLYQATTGEKSYQSVSSALDTSTQDNDKDRLEALARYPYLSYTQTPKGRKFIFKKLFQSAITVHVLLEDDFNAFIKQAQKNDKNMVWQAVQQMGVDLAGAVLPETIKPLTPQQIAQKKPIAQVCRIQETRLAQKQVVKE